jgi:hypothetical protein
MNKIKITDREALERLLKGEEVFSETGDALSIDGEGAICYGVADRWCARLYKPEPIRELSGWEALDALREGLLILSILEHGYYMYKLDATLKVLYMNKEWIASELKVNDLVENKYTLCTPNGVPTNDKEEARWK